LNSKQHKVRVAINLLSGIVEVESSKDSLDAVTQIAETLVKKIKADSAGKIFYE